MVLKLCGFSASNYYNQVKLHLLEKGVDFVEEEVYTMDKNRDFLSNSPMGKVPFLLTEEGPVSESLACAEFIESAYAQNPLLPSAPYAAAKVREIIVHMILDLELPARVLHPQALWGGKLSDTLIARQKRILEKGVAAFARMARFSPFIAGESFTLADCAAAAHLGVVGNVCKTMYGEDLLLAGLPACKDYLKMLRQRPAVQKMAEDRRISTAAFMERVSAMQQSR